MNHFLDGKLFVFLFKFAITRNTTPLSVRYTSSIYSPVLFSKTPESYRCHFVDLSSPASLCPELLVRPDMAKEQPCRPNLPTPFYSIISDSANQAAEHFLVDYGRVSAKIFNHSRTYFSVSHGLWVFFPAEQHEITKAFSNLYRIEDKKLC